MRSTTWDRYPTIAVASHAGALLLVLLAHLAFMASPFHLAMVEGEQNHHAAMRAGGAGIHPEHVSLGDPPHADCAIQWATSVQASVRMLPTAAPALGWAGAGLASPQPTQPLAHATGPPHQDRQVLLQVFRL